MIISIIIAFLISLASLSLNVRGKAIIFGVPFFIVIFLFGFRVGFGTDYWSYIGVINEFYESGNFSGSNFDAFFELVAQASYYLGLPPHFVLFAYFSLTYYLLVRAMWSLSPYLPLSLLLMFFVGPLFASLNIVRQALAFSLVLFAFIKISKIKILGYIAVTLIVSSVVHLSVFVMLLLPFFRVLSNKFLFWVFGFFLIFLLKNWMPIIVDSLINFYSTTSLPYSGYFKNTRYLLTDRTNTNLLLYGNLIIALWVSYKLKAISSNRLNENLCKAYIFGILFVFLFSEFQAFVRLFQNFAWLGFLALPITLSYYKDRWLWLFSAYGLVIYSLILGFVVLIRLNDEFDGGAHFFVS